MNLETYDFKVSPGNMEYFFYSVGPKGRIKKLVRFQPFSIDAGPLVNLVFGDADSSSKSINDSIITDNQDTDKILMTVAQRKLSKFVL